MILKEADLLKSAISEYNNIFEQSKTNGILDSDHLLSNLVKEHDWTSEGAKAVLKLANEYGGFMLRNALALAVVLGKEDGDLGF